MASDPHAPCPCGSGQQLQSCCSDLAAEMESIQQMIAAEQLPAALRHVAQLLATQPQRPSLLDVKAGLELSLQEFAAAAARTVQAFIAVSAAFGNTAYQAVVGIAIPEPNTLALLLVSCLGCAVRQRFMALFGK